MGEGGMYMYVYHGDGNTEDNCSATKWIFFFSHTYCNQFIEATTGLVCKFCKINATELLSSAGAQDSRAFSFSQVLIMLYMTEHTHHLSLSL